MKWIHWGLYIIHIQQIATRAGLTATQTIPYFIKGLLSEIKVVVKAHESNDLPTAIRKVKKYEQGLWDPFKKKKKFKKIKSSSEKSSDESSKDERPKRKSKSKKNKKKYAETTNKSDVNELTKSSNNYKLTWPNKLMKWDKSYDNSFSHLNLALTSTITTELAKSTSFLISTWIQMLSI